MEKGVLGISCDGEFFEVECNCGNSVRCRVDMESVKSDYDVGERPESLVVYIDSDGFANYICSCGSQASVDIKDSQSSETDYVEEESDLDGLRVLSEDFSYTHQFDEVEIGGNTVGKILKLDDGENTEKVYSLRTDSERMKEDSGHEGYPLPLEKVLIGVCETNGINHIVIHDSDDSKVYHFKTSDYLREGTEVENFGEAQRLLDIDYAEKIHTGPTYYEAKEFEC